MSYELRLADLGEGLTEAEVVAWLVEMGGMIIANEPMVEVETDKAVVEIPSPRDGVLLYRGAEVGETLEVGELLAVIGDPGETWEPPAAHEAPKLHVVPDPTGAGRRAATVKAVPHVRRLAAEHGIDLAAVRGTGPAGQITKDDVLRFAEPAAGSERLSSTRRAIARNLSRSWSEIPHVTVWGPAEATAMLAVQRGSGLRLEALLIHAVLSVLVDFPDFNATFDGDRLTRHGRYDIGVAVSTDAGLLVPIVRDATNRDLADLSTEITRLASAAQDRTLGPDDMSGATFTISNVGAVGGGYGTPIIPHGTTAIVSVGRARDEVVARAGAPVVAPVFPVALSFDHRVIDGEAASRFLNAFTHSIETCAP